MVKNGVIVPSITFFNKSFEINEDLNSLLFRHIILNHANGILLFGVTGEGPFFSDKLEEKFKLIDIALKIAEQNISILTGVFGTSVNEVLEEMDLLGKKYNQIKFLITPPLKEKIQKNELMAYFENIMGSTSLENPIYLYNNPNLCMGNEITPEILKNLVKFPNLYGIKDSSDKISNYKTYIQLLNEDFRVYCGKEGWFSTFMQMIPPEKRIYSGIVPSISNISNISSKFYSAALENDVLKIHQLQEELEDIRNKIYDVKKQEGKQQRGLKHAFLYLYKDKISIPIEEMNIVSPRYYRDLDYITQKRIEATVNYLVNHKLSQQLYALTDKEIYRLKDIIEIFSKVEILSEQGKIKKITGPFDGKINTIYKVNFEESKLIFRFRTSKSFRYENIAKEKLLFPFLDGTLSLDTPDLRERVKEILNNKKGSYIFKKDKPPVVPVGNLIYYDETLEVLPYIFTIQDYIPGITLYNLLERFNSEDFVINKQKLLNLFQVLGEILGKLHEIKFSSFYKSVTDIGKSKKSTWLDLFNFELNHEIQESKKNNFEYIKEYKSYFKENISLIEDEHEAVLFHNDFQSQNMIIHEDSGEIRLVGLIDFDNWKIGVRSAEFVKINYWLLKPLNKLALNDAFYSGYEKYYKAKIDKEFKKKIELYSLLWFLKVYNFEMDKIRNSEQNESVDKRFPIADIYLEDIKKILGI